MGNRTFEVVVAGHVCLDVNPRFLEVRRGHEPALVPGSLIQVGHALRSTGGVVCNTGLSLVRLGVSTSLVGKIGEDLFGQEILRLLREQDPRLSEGMVVCPEEITSYSIVINPPGVDRMFLHCPGANDTFAADVIDAERMAAAGAKLFHFGYPPIMRQMFLDNGAELERLLLKVKSTGMTTSLDMCSVDPHAEAGQVNWVNLLEKILPHVDVFLPSAEELLFMLSRKEFDRIFQKHGGFEIARDFHESRLSEMAERLLTMGTAIVGIKLGEEGLYIRTSPDRARLTRLGRCTLSELDHWLGRELIRPCLEVQVAGTSGAGDCTIAGFLMGLLRGWSPERTATAAVAVGAASVESSDAISGVPCWSELEQRLEDGWTSRESSLSLPGWQLKDGVLLGSRNR